MLLWSTFCIHTEMLPVERVAADWERLAWPGPLYSLASLYKHAEACPASTVTRRSNLCKHERSSTSLTTFILNWACFFPPVNEIYQTAITPPSPLILAPVLGASVWQVILAGSGFPTWQTRQIHSPRHWLGWGVTSGVRFGLAHLSNGL